MPVPIRFGVKVIPARDYAEKICALLIESSHFGTPGPGKRQDGRVREAVLKGVHELAEAALAGASPDTRRPSSEQEVVTLRGPRATTSASALAETKKLYDFAPDAALSLTFFGETHHYLPDERRVADYMDAIGGRVEDPTLVVFERGMTYTTNKIPCHYVREESLTTSANATGDYKYVYHDNWGMGLTVVQRSMVVAGYVALSLAAGSQDVKERVVIFFGDNHDDILTTHFPYVVRHATAWMEHRKRTCLLIGTQGG